VSSFAISIGFLGVVQAALILVPRPLARWRLGGFTGRWWALLPPASIVVVIAAIYLDPVSAQALTYLALVAVPPLAALALALLVRGARPPLALAVIPLFALAWVARGSLAGEGASLALSALACVTLGSLLALVLPSPWLRRGVYAMAAVDVFLVASDLLQGPNSVLAAAAPGAGLPRLQAIQLGSAEMGFGDLFIAATVGALLASRSRSIRLEVAGLAAVLALGFDLMFFVVRELPATLPIALALALLELRDRGRAVAPVVQRSTLEFPSTNIPRNANEGVPWTRPIPGRSWSRSRR